MDLLTSDNRNLEKMIETMMDEGKYFPPEPYQNLENAVRKVQQAYLMYRVRNAPEDRLELLRQYMEDCQTLLNKAKMPQPTPDELAQKLAAMGGADVPVGAVTEELEGAEPLPPMPEEMPPVEEQINEQEIIEKQL